MHRFILSFLLWRRAVLSAWACWPQHVDIGRGTITVVESELDVARLLVVLLGLGEPALVLDDEAARLDADAGASRGSTASVSVGEETRSDGTELAEPIHGALVERAAGQRRDGGCCDGCHRPARAARSRTEPPGAVPTCCPSDRDLLGIQIGGRDSSRLRCGLCAVFAATRLASGSRRE